MRPLLLSLVVVFIVLWTIAASQDTVLLALNGTTIRIPSTSSGVSLSFQLSTSLSPSHFLSDIYSFHPNASSFFRIPAAESANTASFERFLPGTVLPANSFTNRLFFRATRQATDSALLNVIVRPPYAGFSGSFNFTIEVATFPSLFGGVSTTKACHQISRGRYYFILDSTLSWTTANATMAAGGTWNGMYPYLLSWTDFDDYETFLTSECLEGSSFATSISSMDFWTGGKKDTAGASNGDYYFQGGPDNGAKFDSYPSTCAASGLCGSTGYYVNWKNDAAGRGSECVFIRSQLGAWYMRSSTSGAGSRNTLVRVGGVPADSSAGYIALVNVTVNVYHALLPSQCAPGTYLNALGDTCLPCPTGSYSNSSNPGVCYSCPAGSQPNMAQNSCVLCSVGWYSNTSTSFVCALCSGNFTTTVSGSAKCDQCISQHFGPSCSKCPTCLNAGVCQDGMSGAGTCICALNFAGPLCSVCRDNYYGSNCAVYCLPSVTCSGNGNCTSSGTCSCSSGFIGAGCNEKQSRADPAPPVADVFTSEDGKTAVTTTVAASSASGSSFLQLFDALQATIRLACLRVEYPLWYIRFVQGFSMVAFNVRIDSVMTFLEVDLAVVDPVESEDADVETASNLEIFTTESVGTLSGTFIIVVSTFCFVMCVLAAVHLLSFVFFAAVFRLRAWYVYKRRSKPYPRSVSQAFLVRKFWIFFRSFYFSAYYALGYPLFVAFGLQVTFGRDVRPVWETVLACFAVVVHVMVMIFGVAPAFKHPPTGEWLKFQRRWDFAFLEFKQEFWWIHILHTAIFAFDASVVVTGAFFGLGSELQICLVLFVSTGRSLFYLLYHPGREQKNIIMEAFNALSDTVEVLLLYSMLGKSRTSSWNNLAASVIAYMQMVIVVMNIVVSFVDMILSIGAFVVDLLKSLGMKVKTRTKTTRNTRPSKSKAGGKPQKASARAVLVDSNVLTSVLSSAKQSPSSASLPAPCRHTSDSLSKFLAVGHARQGPLPPISSPKRVSDNVSVSAAGQRFQAVAAGVGPFSLGSPRTGQAATMSDAGSSPTNPLLPFFARQFKEYISDNASSPAGRSSSRASSSATESGPPME